MYWKDLFMNEIVSRSLIVDIRNLIDAAKARGAIKVNQEMTLDTNVLQIPPKLAQMSENRQSKVHFCNTNVNAVLI